MREVAYNGFLIRCGVHKVRPGHPQSGKWIAGEYSIGSQAGGAYTEKQYVHNSVFCGTEEEAIRITIALAKQTIDREET